MKMIVRPEAMRLGARYADICQDNVYRGSTPLSSLPLAPAMDTTQWIEAVGAPFGPPQPLEQISPNGENVVTPWQGQLFYPLPQTQVFIPGAIGEQWNFNFNVQNTFDQSVGVPSDAIANMTQTFDVRRSLDPLVPQRAYSNTRRNRRVRNFQPEWPIYFNTRSCEGFPMKDALNKNFKALVGREEPMFRHCTAISLRFEFEGYESFTRQVKTRDSRKVPHPIPKEKLAHEVAKKLLAFLNKRQATVGNPSGASAQLNSVNIKDIFLVRLDHVSKSSWQPQFKIVRNA